MDPTFRLRTATRLHFLLLRRYGQDIDVGVLLKSKARLHDGLWLCEATGDAELIDLARRLADANRAHDEAEVVAQLRDAATALGAAGDEVLQDLRWDAPTSSFGMTLPQELPTLPHYVQARTGRWLNPVRWLRAGRMRQHA